MSLFYYVCCAALLTSPLFSENTLEYTSATNGKNVSTDWSVKSEPDHLAITGKTSDGSTAELQTSNSYQLEIFKQNDPIKGYDLIASRKGNTLTITGLVKQDRKTKVYDIGGTPWVQEFAFGFRDFLKKKETEYKFEILHPKDFDIHDMIATKEYVEDLTINGKAYKAQKLKITLQGFKKRFWKAEVWYDLETLQLLRYKANEGPGTPVTETILIGSS
ncbi:MAG: hypothetical protein NTX49_08700 [Chlamydiae bacterium]|nr:hypothetical protein [Chlamydiota bacterium]